MWRWSDAALDWFEQTGPDLATCPITQGTLLRFLIREGHRPIDAIDALEAVRVQPWHSFWPDDLQFEAAQLTGVRGHRQVTDAYLVASARHHGAQVATFDKGLAVLHGDHACLVPT